MNGPTEGNGESNIEPLRAGVVPKKLDLKFFSDVGDGNLILSIPRFIVALPLPSFPSTHEVT